MLSISKYISVFILALLVSPSFSSWGDLPSGLSDFMFGLVNDGNIAYNERMKAAVDDGIQLGYRYSYLNNGANNGCDPAQTALSWLFSDWNDYATKSDEIGVKPAMVVYLLQEDGGNGILATNANNANFMRNFFANIKIAAEKTTGRNPIFVLEPDTWGYILQDDIDPTTATAQVNNLGGEFSFLSDLPNTYSGMAQAMIRVTKHYAPDAMVGILMAHWAVWANGQTGSPAADGANGMVYWTQGDIEYSAQKNVEFANKLLGTGSDRGDFIGVEKNGYSAGHWKVQGGTDKYYWNDQQNANWVYWSKLVGQGVDLPVLGWQISIGHMGLRNSCLNGPVGGLGDCAYEDTFFPYFFTHVQEFVDAGFVGFLVGKGLSDDTDYTHKNKDASMGDGGWFFDQMKTFDQQRPYLSAKPNPIVSKKSLLNKTSFSVELHAFILRVQNFPTSSGFITNLNGKVIQKFSSESSNFSVNLSNLATGVYHIVASDGASVSFAFVNR